MMNASMHMKPKIQSSGCVQSRSTDIDRSEIIDFPKLSYWFLILCDMLISTYLWVISSGDENNIYQMRHWSISRKQLVLFLSYPVITWLLSVCTKIYIKFLHPESCLISAVCVCVCFDIYYKIRYPTTLNIIPNI